jgi:PAS domain S-box-containing protein
MPSFSRSVSNLSDALPFPQTQPPVEASGFYAPSLSTLSPVRILLSEGDRPPVLSARQTYRDLARVWRQCPAAVGVLILAEDGQTGDRRPQAMISRRQALAWRSHRSQWRAALDQPLPALQDWWQEACRYRLMDDQIPLQDAIALLLDRVDQAKQQAISPNSRGNPMPASVADPVVVQGEAGWQLVDPQVLLTRYAQLTRREQAALAEPDIEKLRRQQQLVLNAIGEGVYGIDLQGNATFVNPAAAQMVGWDPQDMIGKSMHQILHHSRPDRSPYPREECPIYAAFQDGYIHRVSEDTFWRKDGTSFPVEYISTPMRDERGKLVGAVIAFRDITQRKWAEAILHRTNEELEQRVRDRTLELQQANEQLKELSEVRSRMVTMVCHEFRNPLNNILLSASSLGRYGTQLTAAQKEHYVLGIRDNVERMTQMIDDILIIGQTEAKGLEVQPQTFDLIPFCQEVVAGLALDPCKPEVLGSEHAAAEGSDRLRFTSRAKRLRVTLDPRLLRSILTNILANAIRYTPAPGLIQFKVYKQHNQVVFQIADQGIGIPPEDLPHLFEPFHRGRNVSNIAGTGLGLNIVKRFVDLQHGQIQVTSRLGQGTTFDLTLPLQYAPAPSPSVSPGCLGQE